ncbi:MAG TPA: sporulation protein [Gammaproteobacteria bacterium]|nr:sporulation protein [Gammaproteobacteria bacterium]
MNIQLKQRLVGAVVLVALAVIFIPMLLPGKGNLGGGIDGSNIPPEPDFRFPPVPAAPKAPPVAAVPVVPLGDSDDVEPPAISDKSAPVEKTAGQSPPKPPVNAVVKTPAKPPAKPVSSPATKAAPAKVKPVESGQVSGWVVQVGSFSARNNARALRDKLRKQGYASFVEPVQGASGRVYRVRVGPELSKAAADKLRQRLAKKPGLQGLVQAYP